MRKLESDKPGVMKSAAKEMKMPLRSAQRLADRAGKKRKATTKIEFSAEDRKRRRRFAEMQSHSRKSRSTFADLVPDYRR